MRDGLYGSGNMGTTLAMHLWMYGMVGSGVFFRFSENQKHLELIRPRNPNEYNTSELQGFTDTLDGQDPRCCWWSSCAGSLEGCIRKQRDLQGGPSNQLLRLMRHPVAEARCCWLLGACARSQGKPRMRRPIPRGSIRPRYAGKVAPSSYQLECNAPLQGLLISHFVWLVLPRLAERSPIRSPHQVFFSL